MKILFVATVRSHIGQFHMPFIQCLKSAGHEVHAAYKDNSKDKEGLDLSIIDKIFEIPFERNPFKFANVRAYFALKKVINEENYDVIHCHTPMGAVITRLAAIRARKRGTKVLYTAHGFHFFKGAGVKNWLFFYPVEKMLSKRTDCLILINSEDYNTAIKKNFKAGRIEQTHGVGVDLSKFDVNIKCDKKELRHELGLSEDMYGLIYPADLSVRKNQKMLFEMVKYLKDKIPELRLILPGQPILLEEYKRYVKDLGIEEYVVFAGYRRDIPELLKACDIAVSSSRQEGLPINIVEAMAMGKPVVATKVRGNSDLIEDGEGGYLINLNDSNDMAEKIYNLYKNPEISETMGKYNKAHVEVFSIENVNDEMKNIYRHYGVNF